MNWRNKRLAIKQANFNANIIKLLTYGKGKDVNLDVGCCQPEVTIREYCRLTFKCKYANSAFISCTNVQ